MSSISTRRCCLAAVGFSLLFLVQGCGFTANNGSAVTPATTPTPTPIPTQPPGVLSQVVFLGDSLTSGAQNDNLVDSAQAHSFPAVLAAQAGFSLVQGLVPAPGLNGGETLGSLTFPYNVRSLPGGGAVRENPSVQATNLSVSGVTTHGLLTLTPSANGGNALVNVALGYPSGNNGTQLSEAIALKPTTVFLLIGGNDIVPALVTGNLSTMTSLSSFTADFTTILSSLTTQTKAKLIVANLPDFTLDPLITPAALLAQQVATASGGDSSTIEASLGLADGDSVTQAGVATVVAELPSIRAGTQPSPLPSGQVLTAAQTSAIQQRILAYNQVIAQQVKTAGGTLIDLYSYVNTLKNGLPVDGTTLTLGFLGGFFSLDGLHLTSTGYALIANEYIHAMDTQLGLSIATVDVAGVAASDPLFGPNL